MRYFLELRIEMFSTVAIPTPIMVQVMSRACFLRSTGHSDLPPAWCSDPPSSNPLTGWPALSYLGAARPPGCRHSPACPALNKARTASNPRPPLACTAPAPINAGVARLKSRDNRCSPAAAYFNGEIARRSHGWLSKRRAIAHAAIDHVVLAESQDCIVRMACTRL